MAVSPSAHADALDELEIAYGCRVETTAVCQPDLEALVERLTNRAAALVDAQSLSREPSAPDIRDLANEAPVIRYVNVLLRDAYEAAASDIHLEAAREGLTVRYRLDGVLTPAAGPPRSIQHAVVSRIKLLAELDIAERRRAQDGRLRVRMDAREMDIRVSTVPTTHGESVVLRLLDRRGSAVGLGDLGMADDVLQAIRAISRRPHGMLLVTGPTGSGKTTTLYAALGTREVRSEKIVTVEDPVEYQVADVTQVPVHRQVGTSFANALRAILRQDPDVIMIGEMRDRETAEIAVQAAMTGHFVYSTVHTTDAPSAVLRLLDLGVPDYLITATLEAVLAQRLVRRICDDCRTTYHPVPEHVAAVSASPVGRMELTRGSGCPACRGTGFRGRIGLFELLPFTDRMKEAVLKPDTRVHLRSLAIDHGMVALRTDGWHKVRKGITTVEEVLRVTQN